MRRIDLNFAQGPAHHRGLAAALLIVGVLALAAAVLRVTVLGGQVQHLATELDDAQRAGRHERRPLKPASGEDREATARELVRANLVVARLNLGWGALFRQLETIQPPGVTLLAVQPEAGSNGRLRVSGEARRYDDALAYVRQMAQTAGFANAHLVTHESVQDGARQTVRFALLVEWVGTP